MVDYYYVFSDGSDCPTGWTLDTTYSGKGIMTAIASLKTTGGVFTHSHDVGTGNVDNGAGSAYRKALDNYTINPVRYNKVICKINQTLFNPNGVHSFFMDANNCPTGYSTENISYYVVVGNTPGVNVATTHNHTATVTIGTTADSGSGGILASGASNPTTSSSTAMSAPYVKLKLCIKK